MLQKLIQLLFFQTNENKKYLFKTSHFLTFRNIILAINYLSYLNGYHIITKIILIIILIIGLHHDIVSMRMVMIHGPEILIHPIGIRLDRVRSLLQLGIPGRRTNVGLVVARVEGMRVVVAGNGHRGKWEVGVAGEGGRQRTCNSNIIWYLVFLINGIHQWTECNMECLLTEKRADPLSAVARGQTEVVLLLKAKKTNNFRNPWQCEIIWLIIWITNYNKLIPISSSFSFICQFFPTQQLTKRAQAGLVLLLAYKHSIVLYVRGVPYMATGGHEHTFKIFRNIYKICKNLPKTCRKLPTHQHTLGHAQ